MSNAEQDFLSQFALRCNHDCSFTQHQSSLNVRHPQASSCECCGNDLESSRLLATLAQLSLAQMLVRPQKLPHLGSRENSAERRCVRCAAAAAAAAILLEPSPELLPRSLKLISGLNDALVRPRVNDLLLRGESHAFLLARPPPATHSIQCMIGGMHVNVYTTTCKYEPSFAVCAAGRAMRAGLGCSAC
jgi:hypothetical protein